jgi:hypothetical protein
MTHAISLSLVVVFAISGVPITTHAAPRDVAR